MVNYKLIILMFGKCLWCCHHNKVIAKVHPEYLTKFCRPASCGCRPSLRPPVLLSRLHPLSRTVLSRNADIHFTVHALVASSYHYHIRLFETWQKACHYMCKCKQKCKKCKHPVNIMSSKSPELRHVSTTVTLS